MEIGMEMRYLAGAVAFVIVMHFWLLWYVLRAVRAMNQVSERFAHAHRSLQLLTETTETGFAAFAGVLREAMQTPKRRKPAPRTVASAVGATDPSELPWLADHSERSPRVEPPRMFAWVLGKEA